MGWFSPKEEEKTPTLRNKDGYSTQEMKSIMGFHEGYITDNETGYFTMNMFYTLHKRIVELENQLAPTAIPVQQELNFCKHNDGGFCYAPKANQNTNDVNGECRDPQNCKENV